MTNPIIDERNSLIKYGGRYFRMVRLNPWISQNIASKLVGRYKIQRGMGAGAVEFHKCNPNTQFGRVMVKLEDVIKLVDNPMI